MTPQPWRGEILTRLKAAVNSTLGSADNERFLEHFRYIIIASQLLNDHVGPSSAFSLPTNPVPPTSKFANISATTNGASIVASISFTFALLVHWARGGSSPGFHFERIALVLVVATVLATVAYFYATRQWLQYLRRQAIDAASTFVANAQALESSSSSVFTMIQEVELVSRGYRVSVHFACTW